MTKEATIEEKADVALSILPFAGSDSEVKQVQASYLAYRFTGFTVTESLTKIGVSHTTLTRWRNNNPEFLEYENGILDKKIRQEMSKEVLQLRVIRNYMSILDLDAAVLEKANGLVIDEDTGEPVKLSKDETAYLMKLRGTYSPNMVEMFTKLLQNPNVNLGTQINVNNLITKLEERNAAPTETVLEQTEIGE